MRIETKEREDGYSLEIKGDDVKADECRLHFPPRIWRSYPQKKELIDELAFVSTLAVPLILQIENIQFDTISPLCKKYVDDCFLESVPNLVEEIENENSEEIAARYHALRHQFEKAVNEGNGFTFSDVSKRRVVIPFSFGKDSLLTFAVLKRLGYEVFPVLIDERMLPRGFAIKEAMIRPFSEISGAKVDTVINEIQLLSDFEVLQMPPTRLYQIQAYFIYILTMFPFCHYYNASTIMMNNEYANTLLFLHREEYLLEHKVMQSERIGGFLASMVSEMTDGTLSLTNIIGGLGDFAIHALLHECFPEYGSFRNSCHMEINTYTRWCHDCKRCTHAYLFALALSEDPDELYFEKNLLDEEFEKHFYLFSPIHPDDQYRKFFADEEKLAFYLASKKGVEAPLVKLFEKRFMPLPSHEVDRLFDAVFSLHTEPSEHPITQEAFAFFEKTLRHFKKTKFTY